MSQLKMKLTKILSIFLVIAALCTIAPAALAIENDSPAATASSEGEVTPRTEEVVWVRREYNGKTQIRLWSCTRGIWLTDWIDYDFTT